MNRFLKVLLVGAGVLTALIAAAALALVLLVDPNAYRGQVERLVERRTDRELTIEGDLDLAFFPWLGVEVGVARLANPEGFGSEPFARIESGAVRVRLLPLLLGRVEVGTVTLRGLEVRLMRDRQGRTSWAGLAGPPEAGEGRAADGTGSPGGSVRDGGGPGALGALTVGGLRLREARVVWADAAAGTRVTADGIEVDVGAVRPGEPFPVRVALGLENRRPRIGGRVEGEARLTLSRDGEKIRASGVILESRLEGNPLPTGGARLGLKGGVELDLAGREYRTRDLRLTGAGTELRLELEGEGRLTAPVFEGRAHLSTRDPERLAAVAEALLPVSLGVSGLKGSYMKAGLRGDLGAGQVALEGMRGNVLGVGLEGEARRRRTETGGKVEGRLALKVVDGGRLLRSFPGAAPAGLWPGGLKGAQVGLRFGLSPEAGTAQIADLEGKVGGLRLSGSGELAQSKTGARYFAALRTSSFSPRSLARRLGLPLPATPDNGTFETGRLRLRAEGTGSELDLPEVLVALDSSRLSGSARLGWGSPLRLGFDLGLNGIDLDRYLPRGGEDGEEPEKAGTPGAAATGAAGALPRETLRRLAVDGRLTVGKLRARGLRLTELEARLAGEDGQFRLHPLRARLYQGSYRGDVRLDVREEPPRIRLSERLTGVEAGPLLRDVAGRPYVSGTANVSADLHGAGVEPDQLVRSLTGELELRLRDGALLGVDLERALSRAHSVASGGQRGTPGKATEFRELRASARVREGRLVSEDLSASSRRLRIAGRGSLDLLAARMDYRLDATLRKEDEEWPEALGGLTVPMRVTGPVDSPRVRVDLPAALKERAEETLKERVPEDIREKARDLLDF